MKLKVMDSENKKCKCYRIIIDNSCFICFKKLCTPECLTPNESVTILINYKNTKWYCTTCYKKIEFLDELQ